MNKQLIDFIKAGTKYDSRKKGKDGKWIYDYGKKKGTKKKIKPTVDSGSMPLELEKNVIKELKGNSLKQFKKEMRVVRKKQAEYTRESLSYEDIEKVAKKYVKLKDFRI